MIMTLHRTVVYDIDTAKERRRITECFADDPETQGKLNELMELIEAQKWEEALATIENEWWNGHDDTGTPRLEFIGGLDCDSMSIDRHAGYIDLIYRMTGPFKAEYEIIKIQK